VRLIGRRAPVLVYLSLLANPAWPDMLSSLDVNEHDYRRYRQVSTNCHATLSNVYSEVKYSNLPHRYGNSHAI